MHPIAITLIASMCSSVFVILNWFFFDGIDDKYLITLGLLFVSLPISLLPLAYWGKFLDTRPSKDILAIVLSLVIFSTAVCLGNVIELTLYFVTRPEYHEVSPQTHTDAPTVPSKPIEVSKPVVAPKLCPEHPLQVVHAHLTPDSQAEIQEITQKMKELQAHSH